MAIVAAADKTSVLETVARLRAGLEGADAEDVERAVIDSELRLKLGDLLTAELITVEEVRSELGGLSNAVFGGVRKGAVESNGR